MPQDLPDWTRQSVATQSVLGSVGPIANGNVGQAVFNVPRGTQAIALRTSSTGGIGGATSYQVRGQSSGVFYISALGGQLPAPLDWVLLDSAEDTQVQLTVTPPAGPGGTASAWLIASSAPLSPSSFDVSDRSGRLLGVADVSDRAGRLLGVVYGSQGQQLLQRAASFDAQVQLRTAGAEYDARQVRALTAADVVTAALQAPASSLIFDFAVAANTAARVINQVAGQTIKLHQMAWILDAAVAAGWFRLRLVNALTQFAEFGTQSALPQSFDWQGWATPVTEGLDIFNSLAGAIQTRGTLTYTQS